MSARKYSPKTLRGMERDHLLRRRVHPVVPSKVEYRLTELGSSLSEAFCGVWVWAEKHLDRIEEARACFGKEKTLVRRDKEAPALSSRPFHGA